MTPSVKDYPIEEVAAMAAPLIEAGATVYQKFTCHNCGSRQTIDEPNTFFHFASCEECGRVTDIETAGCGFLMVA